MRQSAIRLIICALSAPTACVFLGEGVPIDVGLETAQVEELAFSLGVPKRLSGQHAMFMMYGSDAPGNEQCARTQLWGFEGELAISPEPQVVKFGVLPDGMKEITRPLPIDAACVYDVDIVASGPNIGSMRFRIERDYDGEQIAVPVQR